MMERIPIPLTDQYFTETKKRLSDLFMGKNRGGLGYVVPLYSEECKDMPLQAPVIPQDRIRNDAQWEEMLTYRINANKKRLWGHDWGLPVVIPNFHGYGEISVAYGSKYTERPCGTTPVCKTLEDVAALQKVSLDHEVFSHAIEFLRYIDRHVQGNMPVMMFHSDGPFSAAGLIVNCIELLVSTVEQPDTLKAFLQELTDLYIAFIRKQKETARNLSLPTVPDIWWPQECGVLCEDDTIINLSPQAFAEFIAPVYNRISEAFGGIGVHCCGNFSQLFPVMRDTVHNLRAIWMNAGECPFEAAADTFQNTDTVVIARWVLNKVKSYKSRPEFVTDVLRAKPDTLSVLIQAHCYSDTGEIGNNENIRGYELMNILERYNQLGVI